MISSKLAANGDDRLLFFKRNPNKPAEGEPKPYKSLFWAVLVTLFCVQEGAGFLLLFVVIPLFFWIVYCGVVMFKTPQKRRGLLTRIAIWIFAVVLVITIQGTREHTRRESRDEVVAAIKNFSTSHGHCPKTLDEVGISKQQLADKLGRARYWCLGGVPTLMYASAYIAFDNHYYDFDKGKWTYHPD